MGGGGGKGTPKGAIRVKENCYGMDTLGGLKAAIQPLAGAKEMSNFGKST